jgi:hypothetical protein
MAGRTADIIEFPFAKRRGAAGFDTESESNAGQFVDEINALADLWASWRPPPIKKSNQRHLKIVFIARLRSRCRTTIAAIDA